MSRGAGRGWHERAVERALAIVDANWTLLILRDLMGGRSASASWGGSLLERALRRFIN